MDDILMKEAMELNASYGLSEKEIEKACALSEKYKKPLSRAFEFVEGQKIQWVNRAYLNTNASFGMVEKIFFNSDLFVNDCIEEAQRLYDIGVKNATMLTEDFLKIYFSKSNELIGFDADTIRSIAADMKKAKIPAEQFDLVFASADFFDGDLDEAIANYNNNEFWNSLQYDG